MMASPWRSHRQPHTRAWGGQVQPSLRGFQGGSLQLERLSLLAVARDTAEGHSGVSKGALPHGRHVEPTSLSAPSVHIIFPGSATQEEGFSPLHSWGRRGSGRS